MAFLKTAQLCLNEIKRAKARLIYLLGTDDAGKTTLARELANQLVLERKADACRLGFHAGL